MVVESVKKEEKKEAEEVVVKSKDEIEAEKKELGRLTKRLLYGMPTKLELKNYNSKTRIKHMEWEEKNILIVDKWRVLRREFGLSTNLESIRPAGYTIDPGQNVKGSKQ